MTATRTRAALATLLTLGIAACKGSAQVQPTPTPGGIASPTPTATSDVTATPEVTTNPAAIPSGVILFHRQGSDGVERYFTIKTDGTGETPLYTAESCECARWSADFSQVYSVGATGHGTWSLKTVQPDGSNPTVLEPPIETLNVFMGWSSRDGSRIAVPAMDETDPSRSGLYLAAPDLSDMDLVTPLLEGWLAVEPFGFSPDGSRIVFFAETGPKDGITHAGDVYVINSDGSGLRQLNAPYAGTAYLGIPTISISPDGTQAAFSADDAVWVVDLDGGEARVITPRADFIWAVGWSPTGEWITYTQFHGSTAAVALIRPDGSDDHEITALDEADEANAAVWAPDGAYLLVPRDGESGSDEERDLWILDLKGNWITQVTDDPSTYGTYAWAAAPGS